MVLPLVYTIYIRCRILFVFVQFWQYNVVLCKSRRYVSCGFIKNARYVPLKSLDNVVKIPRGFNRTKTMNTRQLFTVFNQIDQIISDRFDRLPVC
jgi:hypothetical protein